MPRINEDEYKLEAPEPEGMEAKLLEIYELFTRAAREHRITKDEPEYWQGRKDGIRAALAILEPEQKDSEDWKRLSESSPGYRVTEDEEILSFVKDARYNIGAALWEYESKKRIDLQTVINLLQWIDSYERKAKAGKLSPAPDAITPDWAKLTGR